MKTAFASLLLFASLAMAQTNTPSFQLSFNALNGPLKSAGVDIGATYGVTANYWLRSDNLLFPAVNGEYFGVGVQGVIPKACDLLAKTNLNCEKFQPYWTASGGITRVTVGSLPAVDHGAGMGGFGTNYDPTGTGRFTVNLIDFHIAHLTGLQSGLTYMLSTGIQLGWGTNKAAQVANQERRLKRVQKERRQMERLQKAAARQQ
jgi:hypothetical protein